MSTSTWTGAVSSDWDDPDNWSPTGVPGAGSDVTIATGAAVASASIGTVNSITDLSDLSFNSAGTNTVTAFLDNTGHLHVDASGGEGGTILNIGTTLTNSGDLVIGNATLSAPDEVTAASLDNTGRIYLMGSGADQALLDVAGSAGFGTAGVLSGYARLAGDTAIEFASGEITSLAASAHLGLVGSDAFIEDSSATGSNSALTGLASIGAGALFALHDGAAVSTTGALANDGDVYLDTNAGDGGSSLTLAGALTNSAELGIGNASLSASDEVMATSLDNTGFIQLTGSGANQALLDVAGSAGFGTAGILSGHVRLTGDSAIEFASGQITSLAAHAQLILNGDDALIEDSTALGSNSALMGLALIGAGAMFDLENGASVSTTGSLVNDGHINLDTNAGDGGSSLTVAGALTTNTGGTLELSGGTVTAELVTVATGATLSSGGTLALVAGAGTIPANDVEVTGGTLDLAGGTIQGTSLTVGAGVTLLGAGTIGAAITNSGTVEAQGGRLSLTAEISGAGAVEIAQDAVLELGAEATAGVAFAGADGTLELDQPASYAGTISGFAPGDLIDLKGAAATAASAAYSAASNTSTLTVALNGGGTLDYTLAGNYAGDDFTAAQEAGGDSYIKLAAQIMPTAYSYVTNFTKTHDIQTNLIKQFPTGIFTADNSFATPFDITADASGDNFYDADRPLTISTSLPEVSDVYMLMNAYSPPPGEALATVEFIGSQGADQTFTLINGVDARDFYHGIWANTIDGAATQNAFTINNVRGAAGTGNVNTGSTGTYVVDEIDFALIPAFADETLTAIKITPLGDGTPILLGVTAKSTLAAFSL